MLERFEAALNDPELASLRGNMALSLTRLGELLEKLPTKESAEAWRDLGVGMKALVDLVEADDLEGVLELAEKLQELMTMALRERQLWGEILDVQEHHRKLADTERKREELLQSHMTANQVTTLLGYIYRFIIEEVEDKAAVERIANRLRFLLEHGPTNPRAFLPVGHEVASQEEGGGGG